LAALRRILEALRVKPMLGRVSSSEDEKPDAPALRTDA
jgi:hypothetical protein